jgi:hypothetical protein
MDMGQGYLVPLRLTPREDTTGTATGYYNIRAIERLLRPGVEWREAIPDGMYPAGENGASTPRRDLQGHGATEKAGF